MVDVGHGGMDLAVMEEVADMTEVEDMTEMEAIEVLRAEVPEVAEEDIREDRRCFQSRWLIMRNFRKFGGSREKVEEGL